MSKTPDNGSEQVVVTEYEAITPWMHRAARERVSLKDSRNTTWYWVPGAGCAGLMLMSAKARIKGVFVLAEHRGQGIGTALAEHLEREAVRLGAAEIEVYAHNPGFYEARGYAAVGQNRFGVAMLRRKTGDG